MSKINFEINKLTPDKIDVSFLKGVAEKVAKIIELKDLKEVSLVLVCDRRMRNLNKKYRKKDKVTDVLAFDYGEIFICLPQAKKQAKKLGHSLKKELGILLIHGILHLAGYNHKTEKGRERMWDVQEDILLRLKIKNKKK